MKRVNCEDEVIEKYLKNENIESITSNLNINVTTVYNILKRNNIKLKSKREYNLNELLGDYKKYNSLDLLSKKYKIDARTIKKILAENNIDVSKNFRIYSVDEEYFNMIDSKDKAYFLGLLYSDGYVNNEGFYLSLCETDLGIIETFKKYIAYSGEIKTKKSRFENHCNQKQLNIFSLKLAKSLTLLGCVQNKTNIITYPNFITINLIPHFIRGYFDGDGTICKCKDGTITFGLTGNINLLKGIQDELISILNLPRRTISPDKRTVTTASFKYSAKKDLVKIYNYLYNNCEDLYMERKYVKFKEFLDEKGLL